VNSSTVYYTYDQQGNLVEEKSSGLSGMSNFRRVNEYQDGLLFKSVNIDNSGDTFDIRLYKYKNGELAEEIYMTPDSSSFLQYSYDDQGFIHSSQDFSKPIIDPSSLAYGLSNGIVRGLQTYNYELVYDSKGNWVRRVTFKNGAPSKVTTRDISYFNDK
jgi:hypothetical protein